MEAMGLIAIIVNCYLIGQCGQLQRLFPWLSPEMAIISIVILEVRTHTQAHTHTPYKYNAKFRLNKISPILARSI